MATYISHNADQTQALGEAWGREARSGWVICLTGDLGSGKTQLVKGIARGLGISHRIQSPTFALVNSYTEGRLPLFHLDLYRLDTAEQIAAAGLQEYLTPAGVAVIEWAERLGVTQNQHSATTQAKGRPATPSLSEVPTRFRWVNFETISEDERRITYEDTGA